MQLVCIPSSNTIDIYHELLELWPNILLHRTSYNVHICIIEQVEHTATSHFITPYHIPMTISINYPMFNIVFFIVFVMGRVR